MTWILHLFYAEKLHYLFLSKLSTFFLLPQNWKKDIWAFFHECLGMRRWRICFQVCQVTNRVTAPLLMSRSKTLITAVRHKHILWLQRLRKSRFSIWLKAADLVKRAAKRLSNFQFSLKGGPLRILFLPGHLIAFYFLSNSTVFKIAENVSHFCNIFSYTLPSHVKVQQKVFGWWCRWF